MIRSFAVGALVLGVGLALGACGDDDDTSALQPNAGSSGAAGSAGTGGTGGVAGNGGQGGGGGTAGAGGQGGRGEPEWACLDEPPPRPSSALVDLTLQVVDGTSRQPVADATVRACARADDKCSMPIAPAAPVDPAGQIGVRVPGNFDGYFEVRSSSLGPAPSFVPTNAFLPPPGLIRSEAGRRVLVFRQADAAAMAGLVGGTFQPGTPPNALLVATAFDCQGAAASGAVFEIGPATLRSDQTKTFYVTAGNVPSATETETSTAGTFGVTNLNAGLATLTASLGQPRRPLPEANAILRDGEITVVYVSP